MTMQEDQDLPLQWHIGMDEPGAVDFFNDRADRGLHQLDKRPGFRHRDARGVAKPERASSSSDRAPRFIWSRDCTIQPAAASKDRSEFAHGLRDGRFACPPMQSACQEYPSVLRNQRIATKKPTTAHRSAGKYSCSVYSSPPIPASNRFFFFGCQSEAVIEFAVK